MTYARPGVGMALHSGEKEMARINRQNNEDVTSA